MSTQAEMDVSLWERIGEGFNNFSEGMTRFLTNIMGTSTDRYARKMGYVRTKDLDRPYRVVLGSFLDRVNRLEDGMTALSDAELKALTPAFRGRLKNGETLDELMPEAFAACREAGRRSKGMRHYDVQILGGAVLHGGSIAEMVTGEGKTLVATLPAYLNALEGKGVHVVTVNDYLARRDCEWMLPIYQALGVSAGYIQSNMDAPERWRAYDCDITYGTNSEFGFDYLRDNMKPARRGDGRYPPWYQQAQRTPLNYAIIDEVDNILIDEARTPLIISGQANNDERRYAQADDIAVKLSHAQKADGVTYYEVKEKEHTCHLTDEGIRKAEELAGVESFYTAGNMEWPHLIDNALRAQHLYKLDRNYMIRDGEIVIIDEFTGRPMDGRQWSDGLHQAVEAKHRGQGVRIKQETQTLATVTLQNFFKLYKKLSGMTGTAMTEANEFWKIYKLDVVSIPTNKALRRVNYPDRVYRTEQEKWAAVLDEVDRVSRFDTLHLRKGAESRVDAPSQETYTGEFYVVGEIVKETDANYEFKPQGRKDVLNVAKSDVKRIERKGRPVLIGTTDVAKSEKLSAMLKRRGIKHELLNAKPEHVARESEIVAQAGRLGMVTISTNMAGRGTDIILGGNPETLAWAKLSRLTDDDKRPLYPTRLEVPEDVWKQTVGEIEAKEKMKEEGRKVADLGGLHIVGTERHESRRIDNQLRGRAGRQGDPGSSRFFLSLQDDLMRIFAGEWVGNVLSRLGLEEGQPIESRMVTRQIEKAQKKVEEHHFDQRKNLLEYDEVMDHQRKRVYGMRQGILDGKNCKAMLLGMIDRQADGAVERFLDPNYGPSTFAEFAAKRLGVEFDAADFRGADFLQAERTAKDKALRMVQTVIQDGMDENLGEDEDPRDWKWGAMSRLVNGRYGLKTTDRDLKKVGREALSEYLTEECSKAVEETDLTDGRHYLEGDWGRQSVASWAKIKFGIELSAEEVAEDAEATLAGKLRQKVREAYRRKDTDFPVQCGMTRFMSEERNALGQKYDRQGLLVWAAHRFPGVLDRVKEDEFRTQSKTKLHDLLLNEARSQTPPDQEVIDAKVADVFEGTKVSEAADAAELADWAGAELKLEVKPEELTGVTAETARQALWNAYDEKWRPEMHSMERMLLLNQLDGAWKQHLQTMDHLRSTIGLRGYAQEDPKTVYKREGMQEFERMWGALEDRVTTNVFRMEEEGDFQASMWNIGSMVHDQAMTAAAMARQQAAAAPAQGQPQAGPDGEVKKVETIRNTTERVGRNDPCPCGSGKKYKNCHMKQAGPGAVKAG